MPSALPQYKVGEYVTRTGAAIPHIMRPGYLGKKVLIDVSTKSREEYRVGILEEYIFLPMDGVYRSIVYTGEKQRTMISHRPGKEIYECYPWDFERVTRNRESKQEQEQQLRSIAERQ